MRTCRRRPIFVALALFVLLGAGACTRTKKLSGEDTSLLEDFRYGVLGLDRDAQGYYAIVRSTHDGQLSGYRVTPDKFLIDKSVDAVQRLGKLTYDRLEGQAQVMDLLADVTLEDPSALAQANAANSLTRLAVRLPAVTVRLVPERGDRLPALLRELDRLYAAGGPASRDPAGSTRRAVQIVDEVGTFQLPTVALAKDALKPLYTRAYLVQTADGPLRSATDRALVLRMHELARLALRGAVVAETNYVREEAVRGLKTLRDRAAETLILRRLESEPDGRVRAEIVEYLGITDSAAGVGALLPLLDDGDPTLRHKARQSLTRIAGRDLGFRRVTWTRWALARHPELRAAPGADVPSPPAPPMR